MNRGYLGDASDHWKGSLHEHLRGEGHLKDLHAVGMFADGPWGKDDVTVYASLLRLGGAHAVLDARLRVPGGLQRKGYFEKLATSIPEGADLFVDPDTGIKKLPTTSKAHVSVNELGALLQGDRVLMVFDEGHDRRVEKSVHVRQLAQGLVNLGTNVLAYESGRGVTMFFVSREPTRIKGIEKCLGVWLGQAALRRVSSYP
jgi:hypothetical protein